MKSTLVNRSIYIALLGLGALGFLSGCNVIYDDLPPCRNDAKVRLRYTRNFSGQDSFDSDVHCARVLIYDAEGKYISTHTPDGANIDIPLLEGDYHLIAFGGMHCEESSFAFNLDAAKEHNYFDLMSELGGGRAPVSESATRLHPHFQAHADFSMQNLEGAHVPVEIDFTKNTNHIRLEMAYQAGVPIAAGAYTATIEADNAVIAHDGKIVKQGAPIIYKPYESGLGSLSFIDGAAVPCIAEEFDLSIIDHQDAPVLKIYNAEGNLTFTQSLKPLLEKAKQNEMPGADMREYLDRQDNWLVQITDIEPTEGFIGVKVRINGWIIVNNKYEL